MEYDVYVGVYFMMAFDDQIVHWLLCIWGQNRVIMIVFMWAYFMMAFDDQIVHWLLCIWGQNRVIMIVFMWDGFWRPNSTLIIYAFEFETTIYES